MRKKGTQSDWADAGKNTVHGIADSALTIGQGILTEGSRVFAGERNPYFERAGEANIHLVAQQDARKIEQELAGLKKQWDNLVAEGVAMPTALIPQIADAQKRLGFAKAAAKGQITETPYASVSRGLEEASGVVQSQRDLASNYYDVDPDFAQSFIGQLTKAAGGLVPQAVTGKLPLVGLAALQSQGFQNAWDDAKDSAKRQGREFDPEQAFRYALTDSFQQALLERIGLDSIGGSGAAKTLFQRIRKAVLGEGVTETIQGFGQDVGANVFGIETRNPFDIQKRGTEFAIGSILGTGGATLHHTAQKFDEMAKAPTQPTSEAPAPKYDPETKGLFYDLSQLPPSTEEASPSTEAPETTSTPAPPPGRPADTRAHVAAQMQDRGITREQAVGELKATSDAQKAWLHDLATGTVVQIDAVHFLKTDTGWRRLIDSGGGWEGTTPENAIGTNPGIGIGWNEGTTPKVAGSYQSTGAKQDGYELSPSVFLPVGQQPAASSPKTATLPRDPGSAIPTEPAPLALQNEPGQPITEEEQRKKEAEGAPPDTTATETESSEVTGSQALDESGQQFPPPAQRASGRGMRQEIDFARQRQAGFLNPSIMKKRSITVVKSFAKAWISWTGRSAWSKILATRSPHTSATSSGQSTAGRGTPRKPFVAALTRAHCATQSLRQKSPTGLPKRERLPTKTP